MSVTDTPAAGEAGNDTRFFGHPRALATLFDTTPESMRRRLDQLDLRIHV